MWRYCSFDELFQIEFAFDLAVMDTIHTRKPWFIRTERTLCLFELIWINHTANGCGSRNQSAVDKLTHANHFAIISTLWIDDKENYCSLFIFHNPFLRAVRVNILLRTECARARIFGWYRFGVSVSFWWESFFLTNKNAWYHILSLSFVTKIFWIHRFSDVFMGLALRSDFHTIHLKSCEIYYKVEQKYRISHNGIGRKS